MVSIMAERWSHGTCVQAGTWVTGHVEMYAHMRTHMMEMEQ